jgi:hypothetical protein
MDGELAKLDDPIDVMYLIHKALSAEAAKVQRIIEDHDMEGGLQGFRLAFNFWATALMYHADMEDQYMTAPIKDFPPARVNEQEHADVGKKVKDLESYLHRGDKQGLEARVKEALVALHNEQHAELMKRLEDVLQVLNGEIGKQHIIARTKRHLYGKVVELRICQDDHLEAEEAFVLPDVRERFSEQEKLEIARHLLIDDASDESRWVVEWVAQNVTPGEQRLIADLEAHFTPSRSRPPVVDYGLDMAADS